MVSRETKVHAVAVLLAIAVLAVASRYVGDFDDPTFVAALIAYNVLIFGGAHAYLAWRGVEGTVPVSSRLRFLGALALVVVIAAVGALGPDVHVGGVALDSILIAAGGVVALVYVVLEARAGYHERKPA